jgi:hypothetical protein
MSNLLKLFSTRSRTPLTESIVGRGGLQSGFAQLNSASFGVRALASLAVFVRLCDHPSLKLLFTRSMVALAVLRLVTGILQPDLLNLILRFPARGYTPGSLRSRVAAIRNCSSYFIATLQRRKQEGTEQRGLQTAAGDSLAGSGFASVQVDVPLRGDREFRRGSPRPFVPIKLGRLPSICSRPIVARGKRGGGVIGPQILRLHPGLPRDLFALACPCRPWGFAGRQRRELDWDEEPGPLGCRTSGVADGRSDPPVGVDPLCARRPSRRE